MKYLYNVRSETDPNTSQPSTTGVTTVNVATFNSWLQLGGVPNNAIIYVKGILIGVDGSGNAATIEVARPFKFSSGVLSALGTLNVITGATGTLATAIASLVASSPAIVLQATGVSATTITWFGHIYLFSNSY